MNNRNKKIKKKLATRNFVAKNAPICGYGSHKDRKRLAKNGLVKHKKTLNDD